MKPTVFDLRLHSYTDLRRLEMAIDTGISQCGDVKSLQECKETLLAYKSIVCQAIDVALPRESREIAQMEIDRIIKSN